MFLNCFYFILKKMFVKTLIKYIVYLINGEDDNDYDMCMIITARKL